MWSAISPLAQTRAFLIAGALFVAVATAILVVFAHDAAVAGSGGTGAGAGRWGGPRVARNGPGAAAGSGPGPGSGGGPGEPLAAGSGVQFVAAPTKSGMRVPRVVHTQILNTGAMPMGTVASSPIITRHIAPSDMATTYRMHPRLVMDNFGGGAGKIGSPATRRARLPPRFTRQQLVHAFHAMCLPAWKGIQARVLEGNVVCEGTIGDGTDWDAFCVLPTVCGNASTGLFVPADALSEASFQEAIARAGGPQLPATPADSGALRGGGGGSGAGEEAAAPVLPPLRTPSVVMTHWDPHVNFRNFSLPIRSDIATPARYLAGADSGAGEAPEELAPAVFQGSLNLDHLTHWIFDGLYPAVGNWLRLAGGSSRTRYIFGPLYHGYSSTFLPVNWATLSPFFDTKHQWCHEGCATRPSRLECVGPVLMGTRGVCNQRGECAHMSTPLEHRIIQYNMWEAAGVDPAYASTNLADIIDGVHGAAPGEAVAPAAAHRPINLILLQRRDNRRIANAGSVAGAMALTATLANGYLRDTCTLTGPTAAEKAHEQCLATAAALAGATAGSAAATAAGMDAWLREFSTRQVTRTKLRVAPADSGFGAHVCKLLRGMIYDGGMIATGNLVQAYDLAFYSGAVGGDGGGNGGDGGTAGSGWMSGGTAPTLSPEQIREARGGFPPLLTPLKHSVCSQDLAVALPHISANVSVVLMEAADIFDAIEHFATADLLLGVNGNGGMNAAWMQPGSAVIEAGGHWWGYSHEVPAVQVFRHHYTRITCDLPECTPMPAEMKESFEALQAAYNKAAAAGTSGGSSGGMDTLSMNYYNELKKHDFAVPLEIAAEHMVYALDHLLRVRIDPVYAADFSAARDLEQFPEERCVR